MTYNTQTYQLTPGDSIKVLAVVADSEQPAGQPPVANAPFVLKQRVGTNGAGQHTLFFTRTRPDGSQDIDFGSYTVNVGDTLCITITLTADHKYRVELVIGEDIPANQHFVGEFGGYFGTE